jgi:hypothetical protein
MVLEMLMMAQHDICGGQIVRSCLQGRQQRNEAVSKRSKFVCRLALASADDRASVAHAATRRRGETCERAITIEDITKQVCQ